VSQRPLDHHRDPRSADLARHYARFRVGERVLLTGHSHQAWPDVAFEGQQRAWLDAADFVDDKWERAATVAGEVCDGWRRLLNEPDAEIALGQNTHELVTRVLSAVVEPLAGGGATGRRALVTTDGEFHTIRRQIDRLEEAGIRVTRIAAHPVRTLCERLAAVVDERIAAVLVSSVLYETAEIVPHLDIVSAACLRHGAELLVDAYHHLNVVPFDVKRLRLDRAFIVGGGYKYCQLGEGNCFLRVPADCQLRPVLTGWFAEFTELAASRAAHEVRYGKGAARFAGATYDPTSHYRAAAVFRFHQHESLTADRLREISTYQTRLLEEELLARDFDPAVARVIPVPPAERAGFVAIHMPQAASVVAGLRRRGCFADHRGVTLRLGPAPYVSDEQLRTGVAHIADLVRGVDNPTD
jgi:kynureninase